MLRGRFCLWARARDVVEFDRCRWFEAHRVTVAHVRPLSVTMERNDNRLHDLVVDVEGIAEFFFKSTPIHVLLGPKLSVVFLEYVVGFFDLRLTPVHFQNQRFNWMIIQV